MLGQRALGRLSQKYVRTQQLDTLQHNIYFKWILNEKRNIAALLSKD